jgi:hypothetical protein
MPCVMMVDSSATTGRRSASASATSGAISSGLAGVCIGFSSAGL